MARYSIEDTTLTALGDAIRSKTGETEYKEFPYTSKTYHFDATIYAMASDNRLLIPVCGATEIKIVRLAYTGSGGAFYISGGTAQVTDGGILFSEATKTCTFTNLSSDYVSMYSLGSNSTYDFEATWYDADGNQMEVMISEEVRKTMTPERMATEINGLVVMEQSLLNITGSMRYKFYQGSWDPFIIAYGDQITTKDITHLSDCFNGCASIQHILFEINCEPSTNVDTTSCCQDAKLLLEPPIFKNIQIDDMRYMFKNCQNIRYFPEGYGEDWDWSYHISATGGYDGGKVGLLDGCYSLRQLPMGLFKYGNPKLNASYYTLKEFRNMYSLDEVIDMPVPHDAECKGTTSSGLFYNSFTGLYRCKEFTFAPDIGVKKWAKQVLDFSKLGYGYSGTNFYNSGITADKQVNSSTTYAALKDDPDWFAVSADYSRYSMDAMIRTINSLPDCSEYAAANGTNTIKFNMTAGRGYGKNISSLPEDVAAVATAKGWTVSFV